MRSLKDQLTRREFAKLLGGAGLALSIPGALASTTKGPIQFRNAAPACGLDFVLRNDAKGRKYQVETVLGGLGVIDFDHDGRRDLWNHSDAIGSVANYYKAYGWQPGERVIIPLVEPVDAAGAEFKVLLERGLSPHTTLSALVAAGASPAENLADDVPVSVFPAETLAGTRYWIALNNFYVITRYNRSRLYASAVWNLAQAVHDAMEAPASSH